MAHQHRSSFQTQPTSDDTGQPPPQPHLRAGNGHPRGSWLLVTGAVLLLLVACVLAYQRFAHDGRIVPGVHVLEVNVGGLTATDALGALQQAGLDPDQPVVFQAGDELWPIDPEHAGLTFDARATVAEAYAVGREGSLPASVLNLFRARLSDWTVSPVVVLHEAQAQRTLEALADAFDRPAENAALAIDGTAIRPVESITGRALNVNEAMNTVVATAARGEWPVDALVLPHNTIAPEVVSADDAVAAAEALLSSPVTLHDGSDAWLMGPEALAPMLAVTNSNGAVVLGLDEERLSAWMDPVTQTISRTSRLPRFRFDQTYGQLRLLERGVAQRRVDVAETGSRILAVGGVGPRSVPVAVDETPPAVADTVTAAELGIVELVEEQTSRFAGSSPGRIHNVALAASRFDGLLIPPDAIVSFNEHVGDISPESGYEETLVIMDGATQEGVGGGVCQVSTTLFRTAFFAGVPIEERYAHGYRVAYYEQGAPPGLDATVYSPVVDFKFRNDTGAWLLVETETDTDATTTTFRFLGTRPNRRVALVGPEIGQTTPPPEARVEVDPELLPGESKILEYARDGASVRVTRVITVAGQELREVFASYYRPTGLLTAVGPGPPTPTPKNQAGLGAEPGQAPPTLTPGQSTSSP